MTDEPLYARLGFTDAEWGLLVGLPQAVLTAASAATGGCPPARQRSCPVSASRAFATTSGAG